MNENRLPELPPIRMPSQSTEPEKERSLTTDEKIEAIIRSLEEFEKEIKELQALIELHTHDPSGRTSVPLAFNKD